MSKKIILLVIAIVVVITGGIILKTRYQKYEDACYEYSEGSEEIALEIFDKLGNYRKSVKYHDEIVISLADQIETDKSRYEEVFELLNSLKRSGYDYDKYERILLSAEANYVLDNPDLGDDRTVKYIDDLKIGNRWTEELDRAVYPWAVVVTGVNFEKNDETTLYKSVPSTSPFYIHAKLTEGGERISSTVTVKLTYPNGQVENLYVNGYVQKNGSFWIYTNVYGRLTSGIMNVEFFDSYSNPIGTYSIVIGDDSVI